MKVIGNMAYASIEGVALAVEREGYGRILTLPISETACSAFFLRDSQEKWLLVAFVPWEERER
nr:hypothetical protein [Candidatus Calescibacterium sp.]